MSRVTLSKLLSAGLMLMGIVHVSATFSPIIASKLEMLDEAGRRAFTYMSLMCGTLLVVGGMVAYMLSDKIKEFGFLRKPYLFVLSTCCVDGLLAVIYMPHNPCAWVILALSIPLLAIHFLHDSKTNAKESK
ncbi:MAG: hypothetical protein Q4E55_01995 [Bacteroidales bacterium]|nr:hypothetical protein [Bacteroidales bacterium]